MDQSRAHVQKLHLKPVQISAGKVKNQAPDLATKFGTAEDADEIAKSWIPPKMQYRVEPISDQFVVRIWPEGKPAICAERRWLVVRTHKPRRKTNGQSEG